MKDLLLAVWRRRDRLIIIWFAVMAVAAVRVLKMDNVYTSRCVLTPLPLEQVRTVGEAGFGTPSVRSLLAAGGGHDDFAVVAFLQSRRLMDEVVERAELKKELFPDRWNEGDQEWDGSVGGEPTLATARRALGARVDIDYDQFTRLLLIEVHWPSQGKARDVANAYVGVADALLRDAAIAEGERRIAELRGQMQASTIGDVSAYLAEEMTAAISSLSSIRARANYAFRVIDPPSLPDRKSWPPRVALLMLAGLITAGVEVGVVVSIHLRRAAAGRAGVSAEVADDDRD